MKNKVKFYWKHREAILCIAILLIIFILGIALVEASIGLI